MGLLGGADILLYHSISHGIRSHRESRFELITHSLRGPTYAALFILIPNFTMQGLWFWALVGLLIFDVMLSFADFILERKSREFFGGLPTTRSSDGQGGLGSPSLLSSRLLESLCPMIGAPGPGNELGRPSHRAPAPRGRSSTNRRWHCAVDSRTRYSRTLWCCGRPAYRGDARHSCFVVGL